MFDFSIMICRFLLLKLRKNRKPAKVWCSWVCHKN